MQLPIQKLEDIRLAHLIPYGLVAEQASAIIPKHCVGAQAVLALSKNAFDFSDCCDLLQIECDSFRKINATSGLAEPLIAELRRCSDSTCSMIPRDFVAPAVSFLRAIATDVPGTLAKKECRELSWETCFVGPCIDAFLFSIMQRGGDYVAFDRSVGMSFGCTVAQKDGKPFGDYKPDLGLGVCCHSGRKVFGSQTLSACVWVHETESQESAIEDEDKHVMEMMFAMKHLLLLYPKRMHQELFVLGTHSHGARVQGKLLYASGGKFCIRTLFERNADIISDAGLLLQDLVKFAVSVEILLSKLGRPTMPSALQPDRVHAVTALAVMRTVATPAAVVVSTSLRSDRGDRAHGDRGGFGRHQRRHDDANDDQHREVRPPAPRAPALPFLPSSQTGVLHQRVMSVCGVCILEQYPSPQSESQHYCVQDVKSGVKMFAKMTDAARGEREVDCFKLAQSRGCKALLPILRWHVDGTDALLLLPLARPIDWRCRSDVILALQALEDLHGCGIVHLDLKPAHFVKTPDGRVCIIDAECYFDLRRPITFQHAIGTVPFQAPEVVRVRPDMVSAASDIWSFGVSLLVSTMPHVLSRDASVASVLLPDIPLLNCQRGHKQWSGVRSRSVRVSDHLQQPFWRNLKSCRSSSSRRASQYIDSEDIVQLLYEIFVGIFCIYFQQHLLCTKLGQFVKTGSRLSKMMTCGDCAVDCLNYPQVSAAAW
eukprot:TRINITY_DN4572_c0_g1_i1.p1 TRINITY_DN4572_c0_g1~~TRINITY_DN4572_c0_g1_i1.p1  ORF type:complete len:712 (+),score=95.81 TRINITY_DN4572_c0_g1_i1:830-2965(+)